MSTSVPEERLAGRPDREVWKGTQSAARFLVTQDMDFSDVRMFAPETHAGILIIRLGEPSRRALTERIESVFREESVDSWTACLVVATDRKIRIRRP